MSIEWLRADWPAPRGIVAGTTCRAGGVSDGPYESLNLGAHVGDRRECVAENRKRFVDACGLPGEPEWLSQVHGTVVRAPGDDPAAAADAAIGRQPGDVCAVLTADCLPILLCSTDGREFAAVHAGWRGVAAGVVAATVARMDSAPEDLVAWLGPAISQPAFEVGDEVRAAFMAGDEGAAAAFGRNAAGRWQADLYALARRRLAAAGVDAVYGGGRCTVGEPDLFFSYRRDGECGRMATFVFRRV